MRCTKLNNKNIIQQQTYPINKKNHVFLHKKGIFERKKKDLKLLGSRNNNKCGRGQGQIATTPPPLMGDPTQS